MQQSKGWLRSKDDLKLEKIDRRQFKPIYIYHLLGTSYDLIHPMFSLASDGQPALK